VPQPKLELGIKYFTAPEIQRKLNLSRWQLTVRIERGILPRPTYVDVATGIRYFDHDWLRAAEIMLKMKKEEAEELPV
jgi:hypothetical protein